MHGIKMSTKKITTTIIETHQLTIIRRRQTKSSADAATEPPADPYDVIIDVPAREVRGSFSDGNANDADRVVAANDYPKKPEGERH